MPDYPQIILKKEKERSVQRFHPWIFSGALYSFDAGLPDGAIVEVYDAKKNYLCTGHFYHGSIAVKILTFVQQPISQDFWNQKIQQAFLLRKSLGLIGNVHTNCFRLVHAEGDNLPGLIIDVYDTTAVIQCHSVGMHHAIQEVKNAIQQALPFVDAIFDKSRENLPKEYAESVRNSFLLGEHKEITAVENDNKFLIDVVTGQKTGFFLDQRDNRNLLAAYCKGRTVLNTYCYSGGFSIYGLNNHAEKVVSVDVSKTAMQLVDKNVALNFNSPEIDHVSVCKDVFDYFKANEENYDVIILDPPAFAKSINKRHNAVQAYKRLNAEGLKKVNKGGFIFTFSCSQVVDKELFYATVMSAAIEAGRNVKILHYLLQPADHPVNIFHPESSYLKGLVLYVD